MAVAFLPCVKFKTKPFGFSFQFNYLHTLSKNLPPLTKKDEDTNKRAAQNPSDLHPGNVFVQGLIPMDVLP